jgi:OOP family OmpA-OmpF porin
MRVKNPAEKSVKSIRKLGLGVALLVSVPFAIGIISPAMAEDSGWYVGANAGQSRAKIDDPRIRDNLLTAGFTTTALKDDDKHFGYKLFGGYQFIKYFALEGGYFDLGRFGFTANTMPPGGLTGDIKLKGGDIDAVGILPFTDKFAAFGRVGYAYTDVKDRFVGYGPVGIANPQRSQNSSNYKYGFGLQYAVTTAWGVRAEAERYRVGDAIGNKGDIDLYSVGVLYRFGQTHSRMPVVQAAPPPPPVAEAEPVFVIVPVPAKTSQYCSILDIEFEINQDEMQREVKEKLAVLGTFLTKYPDTTAVIEGHSDDVGSDEDNIRLSQRRADSVVTYLVATLHVPAAQLSAVGYGKSRPIANNATEEGKRRNRRIDAVVACATDIAGLAVIPARMTMALLIEFDRDMAVVKPQYRGDLQNVANFLKAHPTVTATVEGHTANIQPSPEARLKISLQRAQNVVNYLVENFGIDRSRLAARGFGDTRRFAYNTSAEGRQENRRVNIIINYPPGPRVSAQALDSNAP